jgi:hypothetical protein
MGPLRGLFYFPKPTRTKPLPTAHPEQANERQEPRSEPDDRRRDDRPRAHRSWRDRHFRLSRRRGAPDLRRDLPAERGPAHPGPPRAGRRPRRRGLCAFDRQAGRCTGDLRPRRHQHGDAAHRRADGLDPAGLHLRPGADASDRQRRVPGMRHRRHHAPLHQAQLAGARRQRSRKGAARGVLRCDHGSAGPGARRRAQGRAVRDRHLSSAAQIRRASLLRAAREGRCGANPQGRRAARRRQAPRDL